MGIKDHYKKKVKEICERQKDIGEIFEYASSPSSKVDIIWITQELLNNNEISIDCALKIASVCVNDADPEPNDRFDKEIMQGEDTHIIATVRGSACWLLKSIIEKFDTRYYPEIFRMIEKLASIKTEPSAYVRRQATVPLSAIIRNLRAKQNKDGTPFKIDDNTKHMLIALAYKMLNENIKLPRVLEYVATVFDSMRDLDSNNAQYVLKTFFYEPGSEELRPSYLTEHVAPLAIYFAEFRSTAFKDGFDDRPFKNFLTKLIKDSAKSERLRTTLIWLFWKTLEEDLKTYDRLDNYIDLFFEGNFQLESIHQIEFLIMQTLKIDVKANSKRFSKYLDLMINGLEKQRANPHLMMVFEAGNILKEIETGAPEDIPGLLVKLAVIAAFDVYIGNMKEYTDALPAANLPEDLKNKIKLGLNRLLPRIKRSDPSVPESVG